MARLSKGGAALGAVVALVATFEGLRTQAYKDPIGIPTICFGETRGVKMGDKATPEQCKALLQERLVEFSGNIDRCLKADVPDNAYAAFASLAYNIGQTAFCSSTLVKKANAGDIPGACKEISRWDKASGIRLPGLVKRRAEERALCESSL